MQALAGVKEKIPGTAEHKATHPTTGHGHVAGGMGTTGMGGMGTGTTHTTTTGTTGTHGGGIGAKVGAVSIAVLHEQFARCLCYAGGRGSHACCVE